MVIVFNWSWHVYCLVARDLGRVVTRPCRNIAHVSLAQIDILAGVAANVKIFQKSVLLPKIIGNKLCSVMLQADRHCSAAACCCMMLNCLLLLGKKN